MQGGGEERVEKVCVAFFVLVIVGLRHARPPPVTPRRIAVFGRRLVWTCIFVGHKYLGVRGPNGAAWGAVNAVSHMYSCTQPKKKQLFYYRGYGFCDRVFGLLADAIRGVTSASCKAWTKNRRWVFFWWGACNGYIGKYCFRYLSSVVLINR